MYVDYAKIYVLVVSSLTDCCPSEIERPAPRHVETMICFIIA